MYITDSLPVVDCKNNGSRKEVIIMTKFKIGRNAGNGRFTTVKTAITKPKTHVVETIKKK